MKTLSKLLLVLSLIVVSGCSFFQDTKKENTTSEQTFETPVTTNETFGVNLSNKTYIWEQLEKSNESYEGGIK